MITVLQQTTVKEADGTLVCNKKLMEDATDGVDDKKYIVERMFFNKKKLKQDIYDTQEEALNNYNKD